MSKLDIIKTANISFMLERDRMEYIEQQQFLVARGFFYRLFAKTLYLEPSPENLYEFYSNTQMNNLCQGFAENTAEQEFFIALQLLDKYTVEDWQRLRNEYRRLFLQPEHVLVCPWESVYLSREQVIFDEHTLAVQEFYQRFGMKAPHRSEGPADHIGIECSFMAYLSELGLNADNKGSMAVDHLAAQQLFLQEHIGRFIEKFCSALAEESFHIFYKTLAKFLYAYVTTDIAILQEMRHIASCKEEKINEV